jgi:hypothetical protein
VICLVRSPKIAFTSRDLQDFSRLPTSRDFRMPDQEQLSKNTESIEQQTYLSTESLSAQPLRHLHQPSTCLRPDATLEVGWNQLWAVDSCHRPQRSPRKEGSKPAKSDVSDLPETSDFVCESSRQGSQAVGPQINSQRQSADAPGPRVWLIAVVRARRPPL